MTLNNLITCLENAKNAIGRDVEVNMQNNFNEMDINSILFLESANKLIISSSHVTIDNQSVHSFGFTNYVNIDHLFYDSKGRL